jgi:hypothetical protein
MLKIDFYFLSVGLLSTDDAKVKGEKCLSRIKNGYFRLYSCIPV